MIDRSAEITAIMEFIDFVKGFDIKLMEEGDDWVVEDDDEVHITTYDEITEFRLDELIKVFMGGC